MISRGIKRLCDSPELIENYAQAWASDELWECHHRAETDEGLTARDLKKLGRYYAVRPEELIFLPPFIHEEWHKEFKGPPDDVL